jgi:hypothetical protein
MKHNSQSNTILSYGIEKKIESIGLICQTRDSDHETKTIQ